MKPSNDQYPVLRTATLTLHTGEGNGGGLVFDDHPEVIVPLPATSAKTLLVMQEAWAQAPGVPTRDRGFRNRHSMHTDYTIKFNIISMEAVSKYVLRLDNKIKNAFPHLDVPPPLVERQRNKGAHLVRDVQIVDLGKKARPKRRQQAREQLREYDGLSAN